MHAPRLVGHLGDPQVHAGAGQRQRRPCPGRAGAASRPTIASSASPIAALRSALKPKVIRPAGVSACTTPAAGGDQVEPAASVVIAHSMAVPATSPSPCAACPSPRHSSAPGTVTGRYRIDPATSSLQSMLPPAIGPRRDRRMLAGLAGARPITPRNGASGTGEARVGGAVARVGVEFPQQPGRRPSARPRRRVTGVSRPAATVQPQSPGRRSIRRTPDVARLRAADRDRAGQAVPARRPGTSGAALARVVCRSR